MVLKADSLTLRLDGGGSPVFDGVNIGLEAGETCLLRGGSGSGKTMLGLTLCGFLPLKLGSWQLDGSIELFGTPLTQGDTREHIGIILENPYTQLSGMKKTVREELAFPLECLGTPPGEMIPLIERYASYMGVSRLLDRNVRTLSGGELQRILIAEALVARPRFLFLDRPLTEIDTEYRDTVLRLVKDEVTKNHGAALIAEDPWLFPEVIFDREYGINENNIQSNQIPVFPCGKPVSEATLLTVDSLHFSYSQDSPLISGLSFDVRPGEIVFVDGPNGSGKTTLAGLLTGILHKQSGHILIDGKPAEEYREIERFAKIGYAVQNPALNLSRKTVREEIHMMPEKGESAGELIRILGIDTLMDRHPLELTQAEKKRLGMVLACGGEQNIVILDESSQYQDRDGFLRVAEAVNHCAGKGMGLLIITHDPRLYHAFPEGSVVKMTGSVM